MRRDFDNIVVVGYSSTVDFGGGRPATGGRTLWLSSHRAHISGQSALGLDASQAPRGYRQADNILITGFRPPLILAAIAPQWFFLTSSWHYRPRGQYLSKGFGGQMVKWYRR
jgi:hypothetical protein